MLESFGTWLINPCDNLDTPILERGVNYFIGYSPELTRKTSSPAVITCLSQYQSPDINEYVKNTAKYYFQLNFLTEDYFVGLDFANNIVKSFTHIFGADFEDLSEANYRYRCGSTHCNGVYHKGTDDKKRHVFSADIIITAQRYYQPPVCIDIESINDLALIGVDPDYPLDGYFCLANNIDATSTLSWDSGKGWTPILNFSGSLDGNGYTISNLFINRTTQYNALFGIISGRISNLKMSNCNITGTSRTGALVGESTGNIINCSLLSGTIVGTGSTGGLIGKALSGSVTNCSSNCSVTGNLYTGGLIGNNSATVAGCKSTGLVTGYEFAGGLIGEHYSSRSVINCYSHAEVTATLSASGLICSSANCYNSYSTGLVTCAGALKGGLIAQNLGGSILHCFYDTQTSGMSDAINGTPKTTIQMKTLSTFSEWDSNNVWYLEPGEYPILRWELI